MADNYGKTNLMRGFRMFDGADINRLFSRVFQGGLSREDNITATPGGTKAAARPLVRSLNHITVCATANNSVLAPKAIAGSILLVRNDGATTLALFGKDADTIDGVATGTANTIAAGKAKQYFCLTTGQWLTLSVQA